MSTHHITIMVIHQTIMMVSIKIDCTKVTIGGNDMYDKEMTKKSTAEFVRTLRYKFLNKKAMTSMKF